MSDAHPEVPKGLTWCSDEAPGVARRHAGRGFTYHDAKGDRVDDDATLHAMRLIWRHCKQLVEPSSAITLAAVLAEPRRFAGQRVGMVLSGGNVDLDGLPGLFSARH